MTTSLGITCVINFCLDAVQYLLLAIKALDLTFLQA